MRARSVESYAVSIPRAALENVGGAGSPAMLVNPSARYSRATTYGTVYSSRFETTLVKITADDGTCGWGESQAPVLPEVTKSIIDGLMASLIMEADDISPLPIRESLYTAMRVRGHTGGFYIDALSAVDCALWDIAGKRANTSVCRMLGGPVRTDLPVYISGLVGDSIADRIEYFHDAVRNGANAFKVFMSSSSEECLELVKKMRGAASDIRIFVDALWRMRLPEALKFAMSLEASDVSWLESPLVPEDVNGLQQLARRSSIAIAAGETYRTATEVLPFLQCRAVEYLQPDIGRSGISEGMELAALARAFHTRLAPHISIGLGPQIASALHVAACWPHLEIVECNPQVYQLANEFLQSPLQFTPYRVSVPSGAGLGIEIDEAKLAQYNLPSDRLPNLPPL